MNYAFPLLLLLLLLIPFHAPAAHSPEYDRLYNGFLNPQDTARTKVWWFHGETEGTHQGITADLEAFRQAGVGGVVYYDQVHGNGEGAAQVFTPEWWDEIVFSAQEAQRLTPLQSKTTLPQRNHQTSSQPQ